MTLHKLSAGSGYEYLTRQVAAGDDSGIGRRGLEDYYAAKGESPGRWTGSGLVGIDGLEPGDRVTSEQMRHLFGAGRHPLTGVALGAAYRVYDSDGGGFNAEVARRLEGRADGSTEPAERLAEAAAARNEVAREYFAREQGREPRDARELASALTRYSRPQRTAVAGYDLTFSPVKSVSTLWAIAPPEISQVVAEAHEAAVQDALTFLERQVLYTREGKNGARQVETRGLIAAAFTHRDSRDGDPDLHTHVAVANKVQTVEGKWLSIYGRVLHQHVVAASEVYNTAVEAHLRASLGIRFVERPGGSADRRPVREVEGVDRTLCELWSRRRGDITARQEVLSRQFLEAHGRPPTPVEQIALAQQANLETRAAKHEPRSLAAQRDTWWAEAAGVLGAEGVQQMVATVLGQTGRPVEGVSEDWVHEAAQRVVAEVEARRATWQVWHLQAEAQRQVRGLDLHPSMVVDVVGRVVDAATVARSVNLTPDLDPIPEPGALRRSDGTSVYRHTGSDHYTSLRVLEAEQRITSAAARGDGAAFAREDAQLAVLEASVQGRDLNRGQADLVLALASSGRRVQLVLAPAGSGKTTAMRVLADAWRAHVGPVIGLAPSAAAASVLAEATGIPSETLDKLVHDLEHGRRSWLDDAIGPDTLVVVDEAGMADTLTLDRVITHALGRGASVRLIGDDQQLAAVGAGGVLRDIANAHGAVRLDEVVRFSDSAEAEATLALRAGDATALGFYLDRDRVHVGDVATTVEAVFTAWSRDRASGRDCLMLAPTRELVTSLNTRARAARLGGGTPDREVLLADGTRASAGDVVITRRNDRRLGVGSTDWVKNGDRWTVTAVDGPALSVRHLSSGLRTRLPAGYVAEHVELGYAATVHTAQGVTTDTMHGIITGQESRQLLYTMLTRGRHENHVHVVSATDTDGHTLPLIETTSPATATETLQGVLARDGAAVSATTERARAADPAALLHQAAERYEDGLLAGAERLLGPGWGDDIESAAAALVPGLTHAPAWPSLRAHLMLTQADGRDALQTLTNASTYRGLGDADDPAAVLLSRLDRRPAGGPLPWLPAIPKRLATDPVWGGYLTARAERVRSLAAQVRQGTTPEQQWAAPLAHHISPELVADLTVWRAARAVDHSDLRPVGPPDAGGAAGRYARGLLCRVTGQLPDALRHWERLIVEHVGHRDWFTPQLAERLDRLHRAGVDVPDRLEQAADQGPLPDDEATSALWFRVIDPQHKSAWASAHRTAPQGVRPEDYCPAPSGPALHGPSR
ncbi:MobF family relaxase [Ornithinimicrobium sediminis]|uniref:MobF family relaxase n=1 Tax=Ornithinimicrobium sediminis TaxID=2904603 RepID=UPI001E403E46|nr:MobF family relaxase [Ornithinimicrobium sediminis]MCE0487820.1 relaxase domain-containing protein [Ornithinimicrobium sediminis]